MAELWNLPTAGGQLGTAFGGGISQGIDALLEQRAYQMQQQAAQQAQKNQLNQVVSGYVNAGIPENIARVAAMSPAPLQRDILGAWALSGQTQNNKSILQSIAPSNSPSSSPLENIAAPLRETAQQEARPLTLQQLLATPKPLSPEAKARLEQGERKLEFQKEQAGKAVEQKGENTFLKETKGLRDKIEGGARGAIEGLDILKKMKELGATGNLNNPWWVKIMDSFGLNIGALTTPETQEFKKLEGFFLNRMKDIFGARVTNQDVKIFLERIPTLLNSPKGRERIIKDFENIYKASLLEQSAYHDLLDEHQGKLTSEFALKLPQLIQKRVKPELEKLENQISLFKPEETTKIIPNSAKNERKKAFNRWFGL